MRVGDVIIRFQDKPVENIDDLHRLLTETRPGSSAAVTLLRGAEKINLEIVPSEVPES